MLWFGPDPWEQLQLLEILAHISEGPCSIVPLEGDVSQMTGLAVALAARQSAASLQPLAAALWFDFCDGSLANMARWIRHTSEQRCLPHLAPAVRRVLRDQDALRTIAVPADDGAVRVSDLTARAEMLRARAFPEPARDGDAVVAAPPERIAAVVPLRWHVP